jgi:hypothetical protein
MLAGSVETSVRLAIVRNLFRVNRFANGASNMKSKLFQGEPGASRTIAAGTDGLPRDSMGVDRVLPTQTSEAREVPIARN